MDTSFLHTDLYKNAELKTYTTTLALHNATGIPKALIKMAKNRGCAGMYTNSSINWKIAKPAFEAILPSLDTTTADDLAYWKKENVKKDAAIKDLQIKKLQKNLIEPEEVTQLLLELATKQSVVLKRVFSELPPKIAGKSEIDCKAMLDQALNTIFEVLKTKLDKMV